MTLHKDSAGYKPNLSIAEIVEQEQIIKLNIGMLVWLTLQNIQYLFLVIFPH